MKNDRSFEAEERTRVLTEGFHRVGAYLELPPEALEQILGRDSTLLIHPDTEEGRRASWFINIYLMLWRMCGGSKDHMRHWLYNRVLPLNAKPIDLLMGSGTEGFTQVEDYLRTFLDR